MNRKPQIVFKLALIALLLFSGNDVYSQKRVKRQTTKSAKKDVHKKAEQREKDTEVAEKKGRKHHRKIQDKDVRKRMKQSRKQARRHDLGKRDPFFKRVFRRKRRRR